MGIGTCDKCGAPVELAGCNCPKPEPPEPEHKICLSPQAEQATASCLSELLATTQEWLPIETAPKDGTIFIAPYDDWSGYVNCCWEEDGIFGGWIDNDDGCGHNPTHWIPLPTRPEAG